MRRARLALNQITVSPLGLREAADLCVRHGIGAIGVWRDKLGDVRADARMLRAAGLSVSSLTRAGQFSAPTQAERDERIEDTRRAIEAAAELGAGCLTVLGSGRMSLDWSEAQKHLADGLAAVFAEAEAAGVRLGVEATHPMRAEASVLVTLATVADLLDALPPSPALAALIDVYNVWWDPALARGLDRLRGRIAGVQLADWLSPIPPFTPNRGFMGDGLIDFRANCDAIDATGYDGPIEVEIFNRDIWALPPDETAARVVERFALAG